MTMTPTCFTHPVLTELGLPLPLRTESSWALTLLSDPAPRCPLLRLTLADGGDLIIEVANDAQSAARYVFDDAGHLVSLHHSNAAQAPLFAVLRQHVMQAIRSAIPVNSTH